MRNRSLWASAFVVALVFGATPSTAAPHSASSQANKAEKAGPPPDAKTKAKFNYIIEFMNKESQPIFDARSSWLHEIRDPKAGPSCKENNISAGSGFGPDMQQRISEYRKQFKAKPKLDADEPVLQMVQALDDLQKPTSDADEVLAYRNKSKPDRCGKLKELHPLLMDGWHKYVEGLEALEPYVETYTDDRDRRDVETTLKKYGKHYRYHFARIVLVSKSILHKAERLLQRPEPDTTTLVERLGRLDGVVDETKQLIASDNDSKKNDTYPPGLSLMVSDSMPRFQSTVKSFVAVLNDKAKRSNQSTVKASWKQFAESYNGLVDQMNGVSFSKGQK